MSIRTPPPILVFGWGNPSRGDDALGPLFIDALAGRARPGVECLTDFQLQVEHALDLRDRQRVLFVDASVDAGHPFEVSTVLPARDTSFTTHAVSPQVVLSVFEDLERCPPPPSTLLAIRGEQWALGTEPSPQAMARLAAALDWAQAWCTTSPPAPEGG